MCNCILFGFYTSSLSECICAYVIMHDCGFGALFTPWEYLSAIFMPVIRSKILNGSVLLIQSFLFRSGSGFDFIFNFLLLDPEPARGYFLNLNSHFFGSISSYTNRKTHC